MLACSGQRGTQEDEGAESDNGVGEHDEKVEEDKKSGGVEEKEEEGS